MKNLQVPDKFASTLVMEQLTCSGVFEAAMRRCHCSSDYKKGGGCIFFFRRGKQVQFIFVYFGE